VDCGAGNPDSNAYCGDCGNRLARGRDGVTLHPGFKGPRRLLIASCAVFAVSALVAAADFLLIQLSDPASEGLGIGGPVVNMLLEAASVTSVRAPGSPSDGVALLLVGTFLLASLFAIVSAVLGVAGGIWLLLRWRDGEGPARVGTAVATMGEAGRKRLEDAQRLGAEGLDGAVERYEDAKPVVRRVVHDGRVTFSEEVAPRVSTGIRGGVARSREWIRARRDRGRDSAGD
jgi:hypothetical protein